MRPLLQSLLPAALASALLGTAPLAQAAAAETAYEFSFKLHNGEELPLSEFRGKPILIVNTATECGFKGQLGDMQELHETYAEQGLIILAVPSNDFGGQEPRSGDELEGYCEAQYGSKYQIVGQAHVKGEASHPFYKWAVEQNGVAARPFWNFHKYLIGTDGQLVNWFSTPTRPTSKKVRQAIEAELMRMPSKEQ